MWGLLNTAAPHPLCKGQEMRLRMMIWPFLAMAMPASAGAATHLECMDDTYTAAEAQDMDAFIREFNFSGAANATPASEARVLEAIKQRSQSCALRYSWSAEARQAAYDYRSAKIALFAFGYRDILPIEQVGQVLAAIDGEAGAAVREQIRAVVTADFEGAATRPESSTNLMTELLEGTGIEGAATHATFFYAWIATRTAMQVSEERFDRL